VGERSFLSIGQVLDLLKVEFPDLTISKIRFLESQGLLDPERTPSGYRKFYETDVERLRFILREQQQHYLPLKVIKGRLGTEPTDPSDIDPRHTDLGDMDPRDVDPRDVDPRDVDPRDVDPRDVDPRDVDADPSLRDRSVGPAPASVDAGRDPAFGSPRAGASGAGPVGPAGNGASTVAPRLELVDVDTASAAASDDPVSLTLDELAAAAGLTPGDIAELEKFGLVAGHRIVGTTYYDADCLEIACVAAGFRSFGVEARHLRMYRTAVEREAGFFEQVVTPMLKQRNPQARRQAVETLLELSRLGNAMRAATLRQALRDHIGGG
jgi:DNA-binding transcriptional MerR regulator